MALNTRYNDKAKEENPIHNAGMVIVYGKVQGPVTAAYSSDLTGRQETVISNGRVRPPVSIGEQGAHNAMTAKANDSITYGATYEGAHQLITTITDTIGGLSKTQLQNAGTTRSPSILLREDHRTIRKNGLIRDYATGEFTTEPEVTLDEYKGLGGTKTDDAAHPTLAVPGEFVVIIGNPDSPELRDYEAR